MVCIASYVPRFSPQETGLERTLNAYFYVFLYFLKTLPFAPKTQFH